MNYELCGYTCESISRLFNMFQWSDCLSLHPHHTILIIVFLKS